MRDIHVICTHAAHAWVTCMHTQSKYFSMCGQKRTNNENFLPYRASRYLSVLHVKATITIISTLQTLFFLPWATCSVHRAKQTAVQHKHTLSFHSEASDDKNHPTIHEHKDTFNKGSDLICPLISSTFYIFSVIKKACFTGREKWLMDHKTDCWDELTSSSIFGTFIKAHTDLWSLLWTRTQVKSQSHDYLFRLHRQARKA